MDYNKNFPTSEEKFLMYDLKNLKIQSKDWNLEKFRNLFFQCD